MAVLLQPLAGVRAVPRARPHASAQKTCPAGTRARAEGIRPWAALLALLPAAGCQPVPVGRGSP